MGILLAEGAPPSFAPMRKVKTQTCVKTVCCDITCSLLALLYYFLASKKLRAQL